MILEDRKRYRWYGTGGPELPTGMLACSVVIAGKDLYCPLLLPRPPSTRPGSAVNEKEGGLEKPEKCFTPPTALQLPTSALY